MTIRILQEKVRNLPLLGRHVVSQVLKLMDFERIAPSMTRKTKREISMYAGYLAVTYVYSFMRGNKGFRVDLDRLRSGIDSGRATTEDTPSSVREIQRRGWR